MTYFSRRNNHIVEFSGHEEVSMALRKRLLSVLQKYVDRNGVNFGGGDPWCIEIEDFFHEVKKEFPDENPFTLVEHGVYHQVLTVVEIFLDMLSSIYYTRRDLALQEISQAFTLSGSVYRISNKRIELIITEDLAKKIEVAKTVLQNNSSAYEKFFEAVGNLLGRKAKPEDVIKDMFVSFEDYLKEKTGTKDYGGAINYMEKTGVLSSTQRALLDKIYAYRSDTYGVGHAGNAKKPGEVDALWFLETVIVQLLFLDRKLKQESSINT
jgi:hypothetical protein